MKIPLGNRHYAQIDRADLALVKGQKWYLGSHGYATNSRGVLMHRLILQALPGQYVDHRNHDKLDNRRSNIWLCTQSQNLLNARLRDDNTSGYKGVHWYKAYRMWSAYIDIDKRRVFLGYFGDFNDGLSARVTAEEVLS